MSNLLSKLGDIFRAVWAWSLANSARNWAFHAGITALLSLVIGSWAAAWFYVLAEVQEAMIHLSLNGTTDWKDHAGDAGFPVLAAIVMHVFFGR